MSALAVAALVATPATAVTSFAQTFNGVAAANNATSIAGFTVTGGVDVVNSSPTAVTCLFAVGRCVDLVGSPNSGAITSIPISFLAGELVTVSFAVSGNQRLNNTDNFNFSLSFNGPKNIASFTLLSGFLGSYGGTGLVSGFGTYNEVIGGTRPFITYSLSFIPTGAGSLQVQFGSTGPNDARGPVLDNVLVNSAMVPEPTSWLLLLAGFAMVGVAARRRRQLA